MEAVVAPTVGGTAADASAGASSTSSISALPAMMDKLLCVGLTMQGEERR